MLRIAALAAAFVFVAFCGVTPCSAQIEAPAWARIEKSVVVVGYKRADGTFAEWGTGFCIASNASFSQFLTDEHVIEQPASSDPLQLVVLFPGSQATVLAAVVRSSANVDLAIVSVSVGKIQTLHLSTRMPVATQRIAVGGYPYVEGAFGGLMGTSQTLGQAPNLSPSVHLGDVSDLHGTFIEFDRTVDHGNSGGPPFDPAAAKGSGSAEAGLGYMYENGYGVSQDYAQALHWYESAADHGDTRAAGDVQRVQARLKQPPP